MTDDEDRSGRMGRCPMTRRFTRADVEGVAVRLLRDSVAAGIVPEGTRFHVSPGSELYGNQWKVTFIDLDNRETGAPGSDSFWGYGFTAREAWHRIHAACLALESVPRPIGGEATLSDE